MKSLSACCPLCFSVARATGSLAAGFLVAVAGCALLVVFVVCLLRDFFRFGPNWMSHLFTCKMGLAPIKWTCAGMYLSVNKTVD